MTSKTCPVCFRDERKYIGKNTPCWTCETCGYYQEPNQHISYEQLCENIEENFYYGNIRPIIKAKISDVKRQGRSAETRERIKNQRKLWEQMKPKGDNRALVACTKCGSENLTEDVHTASVVCTDCGLELAERAIVYQDENSYDEDNEFIFNRLETSADFHNLSKPYEREVHLSQKLSSAYGTDPRIKFQHIEMIEKYLVEHNELSGKDMFFTGAQAIKKAVYDLKLPVVYAGRWVQIRKRFDIYNIHDDVSSMPQDYLPLLKLRFKMISMAFDQTIGRNKQVTVTDIRSSNNNNNNKRRKKKTDFQLRKNILNLNYVIPCLMRIDSEELFRENARFFHQQSSQNQPKKNNERWKVMIDYCKEHYTRKYYLKTGSYINLKWKYIPLSTTDIIDYFKVLR